MTNLPLEPEAELRQRAADWPRDADLADIARREGLDVATAVLYERILSDPRNQEFLREVGRGSPAPAVLPCDVVGVVPGAFHRHHRHTGADGARVLAIARELGCAAEVIPLESFSRAEKNAEVILDWLEARAGQRVVLVSLSKGSADLKTALASPRAPTAFASVSAWVSFSGMVQGTPLVEWLRRRPLRWLGVRFLLWWGRHEKAALEELRHRPDPPGETWPALPPHLRIVHVYGFALRRHLSHRWAARAYERLAPKGPNDGGGILLEDLTHLPGILCPVWGADHFLMPSWDATPLLRGIVLTALSAPRQAIQYEIEPTTAPATRSTA